MGCFLLLKFRVVRCLNYQVYTLHDSSGLPPESCFPEDKVSLKFFPEDKLSLKFFPEDKVSLKCFPEDKLVKVLTKFFFTESKSIGEPRCF